MSMRLVRNLLPALSLVLASCSDATPPAFGDPEALEVPSAASSLGARLTSGSGQILLSWMERRDEGAALRVAELGDAGFGTPRDVVTDPRMFVNWADMPSVLSVVKGAGNNSQWAAHWLSYSDDRPYAYDVRLIQSVDGGGTWSAPMTPHTDGTPTEHGFVSKFRLPNGIGLVWLDGRKTIVREAVDPVASGMTLRSAVVAPGGELQSEELVDDLVCDCCPTSVVVTSSGPLAVYRDRSPEDVRDIYISRYNNGNWTPGAAVADDGWVVHGCPVNGPVIAASGDLVGVAWFTAAGNRPRVQLSISRDGGKTFPAPTEVAAGKVSGYVDLVFAGRSTFVVSWVENTGAGHDIRVKGVVADGIESESRTVGHSSQGLNVPQMEYRQGELILAWTDGADGASRIVGVRVPLDFDS